MNSSFHSRLGFTSAFFYLMAVLITLQTLRLQTRWLYQPEDPETAPGMVQVQPERGLIYDRYGHILAANKTVYEVGVNLNLISENQNAETVSRVLSQILDLDYSEVYTKVSTVPGSENGVYYKVVEHFATEEQVNQIWENVKEYAKRAESDKNLDDSDALAGIDWIPKTIRVYPEGELASNIIGYNTPWDDAHFGVEENYDTLLSGSPVYVNVADSAHIFEADYEVPSGASLVLTIDRDIQAAMEKIIDEAVADNGAQMGVLVVMDPETGEMLSMATTPRADPDHYTEYKENFYNPAIDYPYEPGSVFKIFTMAAALDTGRVTPNTDFMDVGSYTIGEQTYQNWDKMAWGPQTMTTCMEHSLNVCLAWVADEKLGTDDFYKYLKDFRIGRSTNIDLSGEVVWPLWTPSDAQWRLELLGANSFGQSVMVTPIQMVMAASALANDGNMVAPRIVKSYEYNGVQQDTSVTVVGTPISKKTARTITNMLSISMEGETYQAAVIDGYKIAGKTGTAQIAEGGRYLEDLTNTSFIGWGPADDPKFLVYIWLEKPTSDIWASLVVSPIFKRTINELVVLMNIPPDDVRQELYANHTE